jgi:sodium transport system permease protein
MINLNHVVTVFIKELRCVIRDKKTFVFGLILPLVWTPLILFIIGFSMSGTQSRAADNVYIAVSDKNNAFYTFCSHQNNITIVDASPSSSLISAFVNIDPELDEKILKNQSYLLEVDYNDKSLESIMAIPVIIYYENYFRVSTSNYQNIFSDKENLYESVSLEVPYIPDEQIPDIDTGSLYFNILVPMMLLLYCCLGSVGMASDLSAGEKERGTMESLLSTGADRTSIITGKLLATTVMGVSSGLSTAIGLWGYLMISSDGQKNPISAAGMLMLLIITVFSSMFFASANLAVGMYARSYREAQTYLTPISIILLIPGFFTTTLDVRGISLLHLCIPVYNILCIIKETLENLVNFTHIAIVLGWLIVYVSLTFFATSRLFKKESVVFRM